MKLSEIHDCEACRGKIVSITIDKLGVARCGYCNVAVDYSKYTEAIELMRINKQISKWVK